MKAAILAAAVLAVGGGAEAASAPWFICDAGKVVFTARKTAPDQVTITTTDMRAPFANASIAFKLGRADPGAGQIYYGLWFGSLNEKNSHIHMTNPGMMEPPGSAWTPTISSVRLRDVDYSCRYQPYTRLQALTSKRTLMVTGQRGGDLTYRSFNAAGGGVEVRHGVLTSKGASQRMVFDNAGYRYVLDFWVGPQRSGTLTVLKAGKVVQTEPLIAFVTPSRR